MSGRDPGDAFRADPLADVPLRTETGAPSSSLRTDGPTLLEERSARLPIRAVAFAADLAGTSLAVMLALAAAVAAAGRGPRMGGLPWAAAFAISFSFFFVVLPLVLFGRTVGMSVAGLAARPGIPGKRLTIGEASRRWLGTAALAAGLGAPLLFTLRNRDVPTPADRLSGRPLVRDSET